VEPHPLEKGDAVALEFVSTAGCNERSPKIFKIKVPIFQKKKNANNFHYDKRSKLDTKYRSLSY
jgi:hypothetical protein